jgi:hypothetical protein
MTAPHRATPKQWEDAGAFASDTRACLFELSDTRACLFELRDRLTALEAAATPPPAPDHSRDATEMVATDEELIETFYVGARGASATPGFRAIYNLGRQHSAQSRQEEEVAPPPAPAGDLPSPRTVAAGLLEKCQSHEPGSPMRQLLSAAAILLDRYASDLDNRPHPTPSPAPVGGLVDRIMETVILDPGRAVRAIRAVADWLQQRSDTIANGSQWAEMLRREAEL